MILSVHNQFRGGFDYYESPDSIGINDDFPTPQLGHLKTKLGVPATQAGRPLPPGSIRKGYGLFPYGTISSGEMGQWKRSGGGSLTSGLGLFDSVSETAWPYLTFALGVVVGSVVVALWRKHA